MIVNNSSTNRVSGAAGLSWRVRLGFALAAAVCSLFVNQYVYFNTPVTTDENSYVFQAHNFLEGRIARPCPPIPPVFYHEMIIMDSKVGWMSRYPPAHSLWLVPGVEIDQPRLMIALAAAISVWFISGSVLSLGGSALAVCFVLLFSPFFQFMYGTRLSHTSGLMAVSVMWWAYLRWQTGGRVGFAAVAGLAWAFLFLNRTYTGALMAVPLGLDVVIRLGLHWRRAPQWRGTILFGCFALAGVGAYLLYNNLALGDPFCSTYLYYQDRWRLGFGADHSVADGLRITWNNILLMDRWLWGMPGSLWVIWAAVVLGWSASWTPVCLACILAVIGGYSAFNFPGFNTCGPYYYFETLPFFCTVISLAVARIRRWRHGRALLILLLLVLMVGSLAFMKHEAKRTRKARVEDVRAQSALHQAPSNALVFVSGFHEVVGRNLLLNDRGLQSDPLVVQNWGKKNLLVARTFPDRTPYELRPGQDQVQPLAIEPSFYVCDIPAEDCESSMGLREESGDGAWMVHPVRDKAGILASGKWVDVVAGRYQIVCRVTYDGVEPQAPLRLDVIEESDGHLVDSQILNRCTVDADIVFPFEMNGYDRVRPTLYYGGTGNVVFHGFRVEDADSSDLSPYPSSPDVDSGKRNRL